MDEAISPVLLLFNVLLSFLQGGLKPLEDRTNDSDLWFLL